MMQYIAFLRGTNVAGKWVKMEEIRRHMTSAGFENVQTYIQSGNVFFESFDKNEKTVQDKVARVISKAVGSEVEVAVFPRVELRVLLQSNPFKKINAKPVDKQFITFLVKEPKNLKLPLFSTQKDIEVFYHRNRMTLSVARKINGKYNYPNALIESKWSVPATTRFWHTVEQMMDAIK